MMEKVFPINPVLQSMAYHNGELTIVFLKRNGKFFSTETRQYAEVPRELAYMWFYKQTAGECLKFYAKNIRKKFSLLKITKQVL